MFLKKVDFWQKEFVGHSQPELYIPSSRLIHKLWQLCATINKEIYLQLPYKLIQCTRCR